MTKFGKLYLIPNLLAEDTTNQVLPPVIKEVISELKYFLVEEVRTARRYISALKTGANIESMTFFVLNKDTNQAQVKEYFKAIPDDASVGIISEAGCPGIADPGSLAVAFAHAQGRTVVPLVGPSSILLALIASGFNGQSFMFHGYLPIDRDKRVKAIKEIEKESRQRDQTQLFMETPYRNNHLLEDLLSNCEPTTKLCIAANLTAKEEFIRTLTIAAWAKQKPDLHKQPTIFVLYAR